MIPFYLMSGRAAHKTFIWISGQSNAAGRIAASSFDAELQNPIEINGKKAYIRDYFNCPDNFEILEAGVNTSDDVAKAGIQPKLAYDLVTALQKDVYFLQCAEGGKAISNWADGSAYFTYIVDTTNEIKALYPNARFNHFIWIQGESDGGGGYDDDLRDLITRVRANINPNIIFIIIQMIDCQTLVTNLSTLQAEQAEVAGESGLNRLIAKSGSCIDGYHFDLAKYNSIADECFQIIT